MKHIELAKKLKALADKGVGGEKVNAEILLKNLLEKHGITIEDIEEEKVQDYFFKIYNKHKRQLLIQIVKKLDYNKKCYIIPKNIVKKEKLKGNCIIECTASEYVEIQAKFDFYSNLYDSELDVFLYAFVDANNLGVDNPSTNHKEPTAEELKEILRAKEMASKIKKGSFNKQINGA